MYTTDTPKISVHEFVHEFVAFSWHCVVFYNIAKIANSFVFNGAWYCVALCGLVGFRASLSAHKRKYKSSANKIYTFFFFIKTDDKKSHHRRFGNHSAFD